MNRQWSVKWVTHEGARLPSIGVCDMLERVLSGLADEQTAADKSTDRLPNVG